MTLENSANVDNNGVSNFFMNVLRGGVIGATEVSVNHPLWSIKTRAQLGKPFTTDHKILYKGFAANFLSMVPITAVRVASTTAVDNFINTQENCMLPALVGGALSALISAPAELIMTHMGKGVSFSSLVAGNNKHKLFTGLLPTAVRDAIFTAAFLAWPETIKSYSHKFCGENDTVETLALPTAGVAAAVLTQPADTLKTVMQASAFNKPLTFMHASQQIFRESGCRGYFKGLKERSTRVVSAVCIMGVVSDKLRC